jgi:cytochrome c
LARRRLAHIRDLERNGRWIRYFTKEELVVASARSGAYNRSLGCAGKSATYIQQAGFAPGGLIRSWTLVAALALTTIGETADGQDLKRGEALLARNCASCHAVGRIGESPQKPAPTFRTLGQRYPIESLEEALGEGIMSGHPDMPEFSFDATDVGAIIAYLKSIQER